MEESLSKNYGRLCDHGLIKGSKDASSLPTKTHQQFMDESILFGAMYLNVDNPLTFIYIDDVLNGLIIWNNILKWNDC